VLFTHKLFPFLVGAARCADRTPQRDVPAVFDPGNKKAPTHEEKGRQNGCAAPHFSQADGA